jgi:hypothetical protein
MKGVLICLSLILLSVSVTNTRKKDLDLNPENKLFIITLDGFRWEELFRGADRKLISDPELADTTISKALYWSASLAERRQKLMPFFWSVIARQGELYGNRDYKNKVNVSNPYSLSYPGYSELLTGDVDYSIWSNDKKSNSNTNILEELNSSKSYAGKVAAFTSWELFPYILNEKDRNEKGFVLNSGLQKLEGRELSPAQSFINKLQDHMHDESGTRYDELTYIACKEYVIKHHPSVVLLSFSGTDNAGHSNRYDQYLQEANNADRMIGELWRLLQGLPEYAGKTTFLITTDHGRGKTRNNWNDHGILVSGSSQTWYALLGNTITPHGEMKYESQAYQKDLNRLVKDILARK